MKWNDVNKILPEKDGDYLVFIKGAEIPCVLSFHSDCGVFFDENHECYYNITHWMKIPVMIPGTSEPLPAEKAVLENKLEYSIYFTPEEVTIYLDILRFLVNFYGLADYLEVKLFSLIERFENVIGDKK